MRANIVTNDGVLIEQINLDEYDLSKQFAKSALIAEIVDAVERGEGGENQPHGTRKGKR